VPPVGVYSSSPAALQRAQLPNGGYQAHEVPFPSVDDTTSLRVTLERSPCFGDCPIYKVEIHGDGSVFYKGEGLVAISGRHRATIPKESVDRLVAAFREARFFSLLDSYSTRSSDGSTQTVSISFDGHTKTVVDYYGREAGMPEKALALEDLVDVIAGTDRWVKGDADSIAELRAEGWDFSATDEEHQKAVADAAFADAEKLARPGLFDQMLDAGARTRGRYGCKALFWAAEKSNRHAVDLLLRTGAPTHWDPPPGPASRLDGCDALSGAAERDDPEIVLDLLDAGADPSAHDDVGQTPLEIAKKSGDGKMADVMRRWMEAHPKPR